MGRGTRSPFQTCLIFTFVITSHVQINSYWMEVTPKILGIKPVFILILFKSISIFVYFFHSFVHFFCIIKSGDPMVNSYLPEMSH